MGLRIAGDGNGRSFKCKPYRNFKEKHILKRRRVRLLQFRFNDSDADRSQKYKVMENHVRE